MNILCLDTETYGKCHSLPDGTPLPAQLQFHPRRSLLIDQPPRLVLTCSLTETSGPLVSPWVPCLASLSPTRTRVLQLHDSRHLPYLCQWLKWADVIVGWNISYDILYLRALSPTLAHLLSGRHLLIDGMVLNYLHSELRPERSLKNIGPIFQTHSYTEEEADGSHRFETPEHPDHIAYNAKDTHSTLLSVNAICRALLADHPGSPKHSDATLRYYSDLIWACIRMSESGVPLHIRSLQRLEQLLLHRASRAEHALFSTHNLKMSGKGSDLSKRSFFDHASDAAFSFDPSVRSRLTYTGVKAMISTDEANRLALSHSLPPSHPLQAAFSLYDTHVSFHKLVSTYTYPLLRGSRKNPEARKSVAVPPPSEGKTQWQPLPPPVEPPSPSAAVSRPARAHSATRRKSKRDPSSTSMESTLFATPPQPAGSPSGSGPSSVEPATATSPPPSESNPLGGESAPVAPAPPTSPDSPLVSAPVSLLERGRIWLAHPTWFIVPSPWKDSDTSGGQMQLRLSAKDPAIQTWPSPIKKCIRSRYGSRGAIVSFDLSQAELRTAAVLSGDEALIKAFNDRLDLHTLRAVAIWGEAVLKKPDFKKVWRQAAKHANFTDVNLAGAEALQRTIRKKSKVHVPLSVCEEIVSSRPTVRPGLHRWQQSLIREAHRTGIIRLPVTGHSRYFIGDSGDYINEIVNFPIQATAAFTTNSIQNECHKLLPPISPLYRQHIHMWANWYDALWFDTPISMIPLLRFIYAEAFKRVTSPDGYWGLLCAATGNHVALEYDCTVR